jgi:hypothetical protein
MDYISAKEAAELWRISERRVQKRCGIGRIPGAARFVRVWAMPSGTEKPTGGRIKSERQKIK